MITLLIILISLLLPNNFVVLFLTQRTKDSPWANSDGFYIIVDKETETRGCINVRSFLWTAWEYDLLSVIFPCIDPDDGIVYYTYNPYSNNTPTDWDEVDRAKGRHGHPWLILKRKYENGTFFHSYNVI